MSKSIQVEEDKVSETERIPHRRDRRGPRNIMTKSKDSRTPSAGRNQETLDEDVSGIVRKVTLGK